MTVGTILHMRESAIYGSPERLIIGQVAHGRRYRYIPVTFRKSGAENPFANTLRAQAVEYRELIEHFTGDVTTVHRLIHLLRSERPSLLVTHEFKADLYGLLAAQWVGIPHLVHFHGFTSESRRVKLYGYIDVAVMKRVCGVITVSEQTKSELVSRGLDPYKIHVVINAVGDHAFERLTFNCPPFPSSAPLIVCAGRLSHEKGQDILLAALAELARAGRVLNVIIYGDGPERKALHGMIDRYGLQERVRMLGHIADVRPAFGAMDFLVIPSRSEGLPLVLLESWAQGTPVVATPVGGIPDLIEDDVTGFLAQEVSPRALARAISRALETSDFKARCGGEGMRRARAHYNFLCQMERLEKIYSQCGARG